MNAKYYIAQRGYSIHPSDPGFSSLTEARKEMALAIREAKAKARNRGWKRAAVIRHGKDLVSIHAMKSAHSPLWAEFSLVKA